MDGTCIMTLAALRKLKSRQLTLNFVSDFVGPFYINY